MIKLRNMKLRTKVISGVAAGAMLIAGGGMAFAYFTATGSGSGTGIVGTSTAMTINQVSIVYSNASSDNALVPGTSATVTFSVTNPSSAQQELGTISLTGWSSDKAGCNSSADANAQASWITMTPVVVNADEAPGIDAVTPTGTIVFNDLTSDQSACKGASLTFSYGS
jgi:hypothetical protein